MDNVLCWRNSIWKTRELMIRQGEKVWWGGNGSTMNTKYNNFLYSWITIQISFGKPKFIGCKKDLNTLFFLKKYAFPWPNITFLTNIFIKWLYFPSMILIKREDTPNLPSFNSKGYSKLALFLTHPFNAFLHTLLQSLIPPQYILKRFTLKNVE